MAIDIRFVAIAFLCVSVSPSFAQILCSYMTSIPREEKPDNFPIVETEGVSWNERPLFPAPERPELCMDVFEGPSRNQIIYIEEEIDGDVLIAKFNYDGPNTPYIEPFFFSGSFSLLEPEIQKINDEWYLAVTRRQDFEAPTIQQYVFRVGVEGLQGTVLVTVFVVNIDDNPPVIHMFDACEVPEGGDPHLTDCVYEVTDLDGELSTRAMRFTITSDRNDDEIFDMERSFITGDWYKMHMTLRLKKTLDFEENNLHVFTVTAFDSLPNNHSVSMMVRVQNVESRPPRWVEIFAVQELDEKTYQSYPVRAIDGDTGIGGEISYRLETEEEDSSLFRIETLPGGRDGAIFYVDYIDRDALQKGLFQLNIVAYKHDTEQFTTRQPVAIIVNDINDNPPRPLQPSYNYVMREETAMTLDLEDFGFNDIDLGPHAQYTVRLESVTPENVADAFYISPEVGYQRQLFIIGTSNHRMLDFENKEFQDITIKVVAVDNNRTDLYGEVNLYIKLENWNDELPTFNETTYTAVFEETVNAGFQVETVRAYDRDVGDQVKHSLMGNIDYLGINEDTGEIYVTRNEAFDYHRQNEIIVQVRAEDTLGERLGEPETMNTATTQLVIQLLDINNTPPTLRLPRGSLQVKENRDHGELVTEAITATDPDTTAHLVFEIHWESSYATKQGRDTDADKFHKCVEIQTIYPDETDRRSAIGKIVVTREHDVIIDYEEFEMLYLSIIVRDLNTVDNDDTDESIFTITIVDLNDNPPVWDSGTLEQEFRVREMSASGIVIGSVLATDIDGPLYNRVRYTILPRNDTPEDLVQINFVTGQISVKTSNAIDADVPPRWNLYYTVIASDKCSFEYPDVCPPDEHYFDTPGDIVIHILDTNNKVPAADYTQFSKTVSILENATSGDEITYIVANDLDRDDVYNTVRYQINFLVNPGLIRFFAIDQDTGFLHVQLDNAVLDRDGPEPTHQIFINLIDNFFFAEDGNRNQDSTDVTVVLLDVNDNAPELPDPTTVHWTVSENLAADMSITPTIHAPDADEEGPNSLVGFIVRDLKITNREIEVPDLFTMRSINTDTGELVSLRDLRGFWGTYSLYIHAHDHGHPQQSSDEVYELIIRPYNYHEPEFEFPRESTILRLSKESAMTHRTLLTLDGSIPERIHASDLDGLEAGTVTFEVVGDEEAVQYFDINNDEGNNYGSLVLRQSILESHQDFDLTIRATDGGTEPGTKSSEISFRVAFIPISGNPVFAVPTVPVGFMEQEEGLAETHQLPIANDPKNHLCVESGDTCYRIYYSIIEGNTDGYFKVDADRNVISLVRALDRDVAPVHTLLVAASNSPDAASALAGSTLTVVVNVREANPRPVFERKLYTAGISVQDSINKVLLQVHANHSEQAVIRYTIDLSTMEAHETLESVKETAFILNPETGVLTLNIQPMASMHGMFEFEVVATDPANNEGRANVRIYLISSENRVTFRFRNTVQEVEENSDFIAATFSAGFGMICNIDQILIGTDDNTGTPLDDTTDVRAHFIREDQPVLATEIETLRHDVTLVLQIQAALRSESLDLRDFVTDISPEINTNSSAIIIYVLAALAALLTLLLVVLIITYVIKTRTLNRRLEALSMTKYGSVDSGLNRVGIAAPGTNKHAIEGSNPIWNETIKAPDFDAISDVSNDSSLVGIEDLPQFRNDYYPPNGNNIDEILDNKIASHNNNFGYKKPPPFNPDFANKLNRPFSEI